MIDNVYSKVRIRVARRLSKSPRYVLLNALLFTAFTVPVGLASVLTHPTAIDGVVYWAIVLWSIVLLVHAAHAFFNSGAWGRKRERIIQEEVVDTGETFDIA